MFACFVFFLGGRGGAYLKGGGGLFNILSLKPGANSKGGGGGEGLI